MFQSTTRAATAAAANRTSKMSDETTSNFNSDDAADVKNPDMLGMLAEVASQTLHSETKKDELDAKKKKAKEPKRKNNNQPAQSYTIAQLLTMPAGQLIKLFTVFSGDELKKQYSYACALIPGCDGIFSSFASDAKAKLNIQQHLAEHLEHWRSNMNSCDCANFTVTPVTQLKPKSTPQTKKSKTQPKKSPKENLNKENKETKVGNSTNNTPRKGLSVEVNLKELENNANQDMKVVSVQNSCTTEMKKDISDAKVLRDHSYHGHVKEEKINNESTSTINKISVNSLANENIMVMVVENNGSPMTEPLSSTVEDIANHINVDTDQPESMTLYGEDPPSQPSLLLPAKPKGKAKFIGTSEEERSKALERMAKIKKYGNPSGNELMCDICNPPRTFTAPTTLLSHFRSHANIKPFTCEICNAMFTRRHSLKYHMLIHSNLTRFTCADCGKKFRHPSHFREHRRRHTGESPFECADCGQRFKTRNTYKRHLKTRHNKVLMITGELIHLTEEEARRPKPKSRRKKPIKNEVAIRPSTPIETTEETNEAINEQTTEGTTSSHVNQIFLKQEHLSSEFDNEDDSHQEEFATDLDNIEQQFVTNGEDEFITNVYVYEDEQSTEIVDGETYALMETEDDHLPICKTEFNETEIEHNFAENEVVIAQTDSNGELHFENEIFEEDDTVYLNESSVELPEEEVCSDVTESANREDEYEHHEETIVSFDECVENYTEAIEPGFESEDEDMTENVYIIENQEVVASEEVTSTVEEVPSSTVEVQTDDQDSIMAEDLPMETEMENSGQKILIPCQVKVCESNGKATLQLIKNSNLTLFGNKTQSINLIQNGKQQTFLLLSSEDNDLLSVVSAVQESKPLSVQSVITESIVQ
ncbi:uncharacterized protein LOC106640673 isoform X2 [Copidosoma floridanum]|uniref:uncharacterized protein LOC106640673 isoform X2 n=2 Tax=Copidosoma floridanum TaxID=29053 RepID=UPI0006C99446|nr:uncharacterized protein LOC106640673 isoform X2 [Copidosoma floridanum]